MADSSFFLESGVFYPFDSASGNIGGGGTLGHLAIWAGSNLLGSAGEPSLALLDTIAGLTTELGVLQRTGAGTYAFLGINGANGLVQLTSATKLPVVDGSLLTNLSSSALSGALPALNGSALTSLTAANLLGALPAISGAALTSLSAPVLTGALPAISGAALTAIPPLTGEVTTSVLAATINKAITPIWTGLHSFNAGLQSITGTALAPYTSPIQNAFYVTQNYTGSTLASDGNWNNFQINDSYVRNGALSGWGFIHAMATGAGGNRTSFSISLELNGQPAHPTGATQCAALFSQAVVQASVNAGGTALFGSNFQVVVNTGVTNLAAAYAQENDLFIAPSVTVPYFAAHRLAVIKIPGQSTTSRGTRGTSAFSFVSDINSAGFSEFLMIGPWEASPTTSQSPFGPSGQANGGAVITTMHSPSIKYGIDFTGASPFGSDASGWAFGSPSFLVDWSGNVQCNIATVASVKVSTNQVVGARVTGYTAMTGTADKASTFATGSVTLAQLAGRVMQLQADLTTHGLIGT